MQHKYVPLVNASQQRRPLRGKVPAGQHKAYPIYDNFCRATKAGFQTELILRIFDKKGRLSLIDAYKDFRAESYNLPNPRTENVISLIDAIQKTRISMTKDFQSEMRTIQSRIKDLQEQASSDLLQYLGLK